MRIVRRIEKGPVSHRAIPRSQKESEKGIRPGPPASGQRKESDVIGRVRRGTARGALGAREKLRKLEPQSGTLRTLSYSKKL